jgi:hypothetical protein
MLRGLLMGAAIVVGVAVAQNQERKEIRSQTPLFWQDQVEWGEPVTGLRLSAEGIQNHERELAGIRLTVQNISGGSQGLPLGFLIGPGAHIASSLTLTTSGGRYEFSSLDVTIGSRAGGQFDPVVIPMLPGAFYAVHLPFTSYRPVGTNRSVAAVLKEAKSLSVRFVGDKSICDQYGYPHPNPFPCWFGELQSNTVRLAAR